jgi:hypothetical protein
MILERLYDRLAVVRHDFIRRQRIVDKITKYVYRHYSPREKMPAVDNPVSGKL